MSWYQNLAKPEIVPPAYVFSIIWSILYVLMALSLGFYLSKAKETFAIGLFIFQLILNLSWTFVFFKLKMPVAALFITLIMIISVFILVFVFYKKSKIASVLLLPYLLWLFFAFYLNFKIVVMN